ncbi:MAG: HypC/HybG/HupF family hydrogenase formation chaperone [Magnetococcales bacterium]|nr:HypC/HybG/HupF family hydrogenase formation chaperone [Magnetococcales bacterium]
MCLAIPMQVRAIGEDGFGIVEIDGVQRLVGLTLVDHPLIGDYVIVHAGFAIEILKEADALERLALFREMARLWEEEQANDRLIGTRPS